MTEKEEDIRAVICDFGLAIMSQSRIGRDTHLHSLNGSFPFFFFKFSSIKIKNEIGLSSQYAPPEAFTKKENKKVNDEGYSIEEIQGYQKGDIFAFGVVLWEIITRQIPWNNLGHHQIEQLIRFLFRFFIS